jgi:Siphovirus Gp157
MSTWQQLRDLYASDPALADDEEVISAALAAADVTHPETLLDRAIDALIWIERREDEADDLRREMTERRDRYKARALAARALIDDLMGALELKKRRAKLGAASIANGRPALVLTDEAQVPEQYFRTERVLMRTPLIDDLQQGVVVPGAEMSNPAPVLRIRKL